MFELNETDFLCLKYMILGTGLLKREELTDIKDRKMLLAKLNENFENNEDYKNMIQSIDNEILYVLKCYKIMHLNGKCPLNYGDDVNYWSHSLAHESILIVRLYQKLDQADFFNVLEKYLGINTSQFLNFEMDFNIIRLEDCLPKIKTWLEEKNDPFLKNINELQLIRKSGASPENDNDTCNQIDLTRYRGLCLIINNENFDHYSKRKGTQFDENRLQITFSNLDFRVIIERDVSYDKMNKIIEKTKSMVITEDEMFIAFFLSHGKKNLLICSDDKEKDFDEILKNFSCSNCPKLGGKPKLFFFVCCQGDSHNPAVEVDSPGQMKIVDNKTKTSYPDMSDFFIGYSTYKSFYSYRVTNNGTFYVTSLCQSIDTNPYRSISDIHQEVQGEVSKIPITDFDAFQMPSCENSLRSPCFLKKPKI